MNAPARVASFGGVVMGDWFRLTLTVDLYGLDKQAIDVLLFLGDHTASLPPDNPPAHSFFDDSRWLQLGKKESFYNQGASCFRVLPSHLQAAGRTDARLTVVTQDKCPDIFYEFLDWLTLYLRADDDWPECVGTLQYDPSPLPQLVYTLGNEFRLLPLGRKDLDPDAFEPIKRAV